MSNGMAMLGFAAIAQLIAVAAAIAQIVKLCASVERRFTILESMLGDRDSGLVAQVRDHESRIRVIEERHHQ